MSAPVGGVTVNDTDVAPTANVDVATCDHVPLAVACSKIEAATHESGPFGVSTTLAVCPAFTRFNAKYRTSVESTKASGALLVDSEALPVAVFSDNVSVTACGPGFTCRSETLPRPKRVELASAKNSTVYCCPDCNAMVSDSPTPPVSESVSCSTRRFPLAS